MDWRQPKAGRTMLVPDKHWGEWATGARLAKADVALLQRRLRARDFCLLTMLGQHHYLTTDHVETLFFPSDRSTQQRLRQLLEWGLILRWHQLEPRAAFDRETGATRGGFRRQRSVFMLAERGAAVLAQWLDTDPAPIIRRSLGASEYSFHLQHHLAANGFFIRLIEASQARPDVGLYHWVGDDGLRRIFQQEGGLDLAPDGWGRYLAHGREITFYLEWDEGTGGPQRFLDKARIYVKQYEREAVDHVVWIMPTPKRESTVAAQLSRALKERRSAASFLTTNVDRLTDSGPLEAVWSRVDKPDTLECPTDWSGADSTYPLETCLGRPSWWDLRPGGGVGA
jgi:hypothetical protein